MPDRDSAAPTLVPPRVPELDLVRCIATLGIAWFHYFGGAAGTWVLRRGHTLEQWAREHPLETRWHMFSASLWIQLFVVLSGAVLVLSGGLEREGARRWLARRGVRIYATVWVAGAFVLALSWTQRATGLGPGVEWVGWRDAAISLAGLSFLRGVRSLQTGWWFIGLVLGMYALYLALRPLQRRFGSLALLGVAFASAWAARRWPVAPFDAWLANYASGFAPCRANELALGMAFAAWIQARPRALERLRGPLGLVAGLAAGVVAVLAFGTAAASLVQDSARLACFGLCLFALSARWPRAWWGAAERAGAWSFGFFLIHMAILAQLIPFVAERSLVALRLAFVPGVLLVGAVAWALYRVERGILRRTGPGRG